MASRRELVVSCFPCLFVVLCPAIMAVTREQKLLENLLIQRNYSKLVPPPPDIGENVLQVRLSVNVTKIIQLNEQKELLTASLNYFIMWFDRRLQWNSSDYDDIKGIQIPANELWLPTILLLNNARENGGQLGLEVELARHLVKVKRNGYCSWFLTSISTTNCPVNVRHFPFDRQKCSLAYEQFQPIREVNMILDPRNNMTNTAHVDDGEWYLTGTEFEQSNDSYSRIAVKLYLLRKPFFYVVNFVLPCFVFSIISLFTFIIRPDSGERIAVSISLLLGIIVYQMVVNEKLPETSDSVALLGIYIEFIMMTFMISSIMFMTISRMYNTEIHQPSRIRRFLCVHLVKIMRVKATTTGDASKRDYFSRNGNVSPTNAAKVCSTIADSNFSGIQNRPISKKNAVSDNWPDFNSAPEELTSAVPSKMGCQSSAQFSQQEEILRQILFALQRMELTLTNGSQQPISNVHSKHTTPSVISSEWLLATTAVDRLFFSICLICCVCSNLFLFVSWLIAYYN